MNQSKWTERIEIDQIGPNGPNSRFEMKFPLCLKKEKKKKIYNV